MNKVRLTPKQRCPRDPERELVYYEGALGYESFVCPVCHWDVNEAQARPKVASLTLPAAFGNGEVRVTLGGNVLRIDSAHVVWNVIELEREQLPKLLRFLQSVTPPDNEKA